MLNSNIQTQQTQTPLEVMNCIYFFIYISISIGKLQTALDCNYINQGTGYNLHKLYKDVFFNYSKNRKVSNQ